MNYPRKYWFVGVAMALMFVLLLAMPTTANGQDASPTTACGDLVDLGYSTYSTDHEGWSRGVYANDLSLVAGDNPGVFPAQEADHTLVVCIDETYADMHGYNETAALWQVDPVGTIHDRFDIGLNSKVTVTIPAGYRYDLGNGGGTSKAEDNATYRGTAVDPCPAGWTHIIDLNSDWRPNICATGDLAAAATSPGFFDASAGKVTGKLLIIKHASDDAWNCDAGDIGLWSHADAAEDGTAYNFYLPCGTQVDVTVVAPGSGIGNGAAGTTAHMMNAGGH